MASVNKQGKRKMGAMKGRAMEKLKASNQADKELTDADLDAIGKELIDSTLQSFDAALEKASPAEKMLAKNASGLIAEFIAGLKEGIESELEVVKQERKQVAESAFTDDKKNDPRDKSNELLEGVLEQLEQINENSKQNGLSKDDIEATKSKSADILGRSNTPTWNGKVPKGVLAKQIGVALLGGLPGFGGASQRINERIQQREEFISTESTIRSSKDEKFAKLSEKEKRSTLKEDFKIIQEERKKLEQLEQRAESLRKQGYSEEDIDETMGVAKERQSIVEKIAERDTSRTQLPEPNEPGAVDSRTGEVVPAAPTSVEREEIAQEQRVLNEREFGEVEKQTSLLTDIRDILKLMSAATKSKSATDSAAATEPSASTIDIPDLPDRGNKSPRGRGGRLGRIATGAKGLFSKIGGVKGGAGILGVATGAYTGYQMYGEASKQADSALEDINRKEASGELSKEEAAKRRAEVQGTATENKGGAIGAGAGIAAGSIMGAKAGAMLGTFAGPVGTVVGGLAGGIIGGVAGSSVGQNIGGLVGKGVAGAKNMLGMGTPSADNAPLDESTFSKANPALYKEFSEFRESRVSELVSTGMSKEQAITQATKEATEKVLEKSKSTSTLDTSSITSKTTTLDKTNTVKEMIAPRNNDTKLQESSFKSDTAKPPTIVVNSPPPTVIPSPANGDTKIMQQPFFQRIRNAEPSLTDYLRRRYA